MHKVLQIDLLGELLKCYRKGLIIASDKAVIYEIPSYQWLLDLLKELTRCRMASDQAELGTGRECARDQSYDLCVVDLIGIDVITPSVAETIVKAITELSRLYRFPILFLNLRTQVLRSLDREANACDPVKMIWAKTETGEYNFVGNVPNKLAQLLSTLKDKKQLTAAEAVEALGLESLQKVIGNYSVYMQRLFKEGLVGRVKITASDCDLKRGWTYSYIAFV